MGKVWFCNFEWDPAKARSNLKKHHISFERAATVFNDPHALSLFDRSHSSEEDRWVTMGRDRADSLLVVHHTHREQASGSTTIRLISARKATRNEIAQYERM